ncbi:hypothetical protein [Paraburkholderia sp.]|uniref:hypothetical protein n=1 Tax=Paraburkholderia sp. TaxID=1926495 RepID=UPI002F41AE4E
MTGSVPSAPSMRVHSTTLSGCGSPEATPSENDIGLPAPPEPPPALLSVLGWVSLPPHALNSVVLATDIVMKLPHLINLRRSMFQPVSQSVF